MLYLSLVLVPTKALPGMINKYLIYFEKICLLPSVTRVLPPLATRVKASGSEAATAAATKEVTAAMDNFMLTMKRNLQKDNLLIIEGELLGMIST